MARWKEGTREFTVKVSFVRNRGFQMYVPKPLMVQWGSPDRLTFRIHGTHATVEPSQKGTPKKRGPSHAAVSGAE